MTPRGLAAVLAALLSAGPARACGPYEVTLYEFGSLYYRDAGGRHVGIDTELLDELARRTGCVFQKRLDSRVRTWAAMADGRLDMTVSGLATPEREAYARFIPYLATRNHLLMRAALAQRVQSLAAFEADASLRLGIVRGFKHGATLDAWVARLRQAGRVSEAPDAEVLARVFASRKVDAFLAHPVTWGPLLQHNGLQREVRALDVAPKDAGFASLVLSRSRVREDDAQRMREAVAAMRADGSLEAILARHVDARLAREAARAP